MEEDWFILWMMPSAPYYVIGAFLMKINRANGHSPQPSGFLSRPMYLVASLAIGIIIWQIATLLFKLPAFILPGPGQVWRRFLQSLAGGQLQRHTLTTLIEVLSGLFIGGFAATSLGYLLAKSTLLEKLLSPYLVASQSLPVVAIAPLLVIWFGPGVLSKILVCSLTVFFPILINTVVGYREVPTDLRDLMRTLRASSRQTFWKLEVPAALPIYLGGLRVGATLSVIGAVVGELVGSDRGLGFLINVGRGQYDTALVFVAIFTLVLMAMVLYGLVLFIERQLLSWQSWRQEA
jgi:NitT/TauT family transport system permease protein